MLYDAPLTEYWGVLFLGTDVIANGPSWIFCLAMTSKLW